MELLDLLRTQPAWFITTCSIFGLLVGSFLNVVIHRLPLMMEREWLRDHEAATAQASDGRLPLADIRHPKYNLITPRSACPGCGHAISAWENIPLLSYLWLRGRCVACKHSISLRYPLIEALSGVVAGLIAWHFGYSFVAIAAILFAFALISLTFIDIDTHLLPDSITLPLLWLGLLYNLGGGFTDIASAVVGAVAGYLVLWSVYWLFKLVTGKEGMGYGDFKLLAAIGAWFGWQMLPAVILLSSLAGTVVGIGLIIFAKHDRHTHIPFGPYLALGGITALFWGQQLSHTYLIN